MTNNKKGQGLPIGTLVIIALAVFILFLVIGFVTAGWGFFAGRFGVARESATEYDKARTQCMTWCSSWVSAGKPGLNENGELDTHSIWQGRLCRVRNDIDLNGDGVIDNFDKYCCNEFTINNRDPILSPDECPVDCDAPF